MRSRVWDIGRRTWGLTSRRAERRSKRRDELWPIGSMSTGETYATVTASEPAAESKHVVPEGSNKPPPQQQQNGAAAAAAKKKGAAEAEDHGFTRSEMFSETLVGSVAYYERHVFLCCKDAASWPPIVEAATEFDRLPNHFASGLRARKNDMPKKTRLTICEEEEGERDGESSSAGDVLMFPDMVRYKGLKTQAEVESFVEDALVSGTEWKGSAVESLSGSHIFVCSHGSRDKRCGACGPVLIDTLKEEIKLRGLESEIFVRGCSHIGGHKYAGNLIVFSSSSAGAVSGHWYGYVSPADVPQILDGHIGRGEVIDRLWRGQMGVNEGDQKAAQEKRLQESSCACSETPEQAANGGCEQERSGTACCQSSDAVAALKEGRIPAVLLQGAGSSIHDGHVLFFDDNSSVEEEPTDPRIPLWGPYYIPLPKWVETWDKGDTNAALAVLGAAAVVAVAVRIYRESMSS